MIVRVRSNLETKRVTLNEELPTLGDLFLSISGAYGIPQAKIALSFDLKNERVLDGRASTLLKDVDVSHGTMLFLGGRMEKNEKSFVDGDGLVSHKGVHFTAAAPKNETGNTAQERKQDETKSAVKEEQTKKELDESLTPSFLDSVPSEAEEKQKHSTPTTGSGGGSDECDDDDGIWRDNDGYNDDDTYSSAIQEQEQEQEQQQHQGPGSPEVRAPDQQRRERLIEHYTPDRRFAATGMYTDMSPAMAVALALSQMDGTIGSTGGGNASGGVDSYGNPQGTNYQATGGLGLSSLGFDDDNSGRGDGEIDDLAAARAMAMSRAAAIRASSSTGSSSGGVDAFDLSSSSSSRQRQHTQEMEVDRSDGGIDQEVAQSLREAGVSEHDIMMALRQAEDEKMARKTQQEEWRGRLGQAGSVNLTNNPRHSPRPHRTNTNSGSSSRPADIDLTGTEWGSSSSGGGGGGAQQHQQMSPLTRLLLQQQRSSSSSSNSSTGGPSGGVRSNMEAFDLTDDDDDDGCGVLGVHRLHAQLASMGMGSSNSNSTGNTASDRRGNLSDGSSNNYTSSSSSSSSRGRGGASILGDAAAVEQARRRLVDLMAEAEARADLVDSALADDNGDGGGGGGINNSDNKARPAWRSRSSRGSAVLSSTSFNYDTKTSSTNGSTFTRQQQQAPLRMGALGGGGNNYNTTGSGVEELDSLLQAVSFSSGSANGSGASSSRGSGSRSGPGGRSSAADGRGLVRVQDMEDDEALRLAIEMSKQER
jgi:hypothetical protein